MILESLIAFGKSLNKNSTTEPHKIHYIIHLSLDGEIIQIAQTDVKFILPKQIPRSRDIKANFTFDNGKYIFGYTLQNSNIKNTERKMHAFVEFINTGYAATQNIELSAILNFYNKVQTKKINIIFNESLSVEFQNNTICIGKKELDKWFTFQVTTPGVIFFNPEIQQYWNTINEEHFITKKSKRSSKAICCITDEPIDSASTMPQIEYKSISSFNSPSFNHWGNKELDNAPMSKNVTSDVGAGLKELLSNKNHNTRFGNNRILFWSDSKKVEMIQLAKSSISGNSEVEIKNICEVIKNTYNSIYSGIPSSYTPMDMFYYLVLSDQSRGRWDILGFEKENIYAIKNNIDKHFSNVSVYNNITFKYSPISLRNILDSVKCHAKEEFPNDIYVSFLYSLLKGTPYPVYIFNNALQRQTYEIHKTKEISELARHASRISLIKGYMIRKYNKEINEMFDPNEKNIGYKLGCLLSLVEYIQLKSEKNVNQTIVDKFYRLGSENSRLAYIMMLNNVRYYIKKTNNLSIDKMIEHFICSIGDITNIPTKLLMLDQGMYHYGFYSMKQWLYMPAHIRTEWRKEVSNIPDVFFNYGQSEKEVIVLE